MPPLPVIEFAGRLQPIEGQPFTWKYGPVARFAAGRPLAWLDDDFEAYPAARADFARRRQEAGLATELIGVNPRVGITEEHLAEVAAWAGRLAGH